MRRIVIVFLSVLAFGQVKNFTPTELENAKLGMLKAQNDTLQMQLQQIDVQIQALGIMKQLTAQKQQQKYSELLGYAETVKKNHGWDKTVVFNPLQGDSGSFTGK